MSFLQRGGRISAGILIVLGLVVMTMWARRDMNAPAPPVYGPNDSASYDEDEMSVFRDTATLEETARWKLNRDATRDLPRYQAQVMRSPQSALAYNNYGWQLYRAGKYVEAEKVLRETIRMAPTRAIAFANLGETLWKQKRNAEAETMYRKFLALNEQPRRELIAQRKIEQITGKPFTADSLTN